MQRQQQQQEIFENFFASSNLFGNDHVPSMISSRSTSNSNSNSSTVSSSGTTTTTTTTTEDSVELLQTLLTTIILAERAFMDKLRQMQQDLDVLDADGAILVYQRLVELCEGSHYQAQQKLDNYVCGYDDEHVKTPKDFKEEEEENDSIGKKHKSVLAWSPFGKVPDLNCSAFLNLCRELDQFADRMKKAQGSTRPKDAIDTVLRECHEISRANCIREIENIRSPEACVYLFQNWLLSLTYCDVSFFVTMQEVPIESLDGIPRNTMSCNERDSSSASCLPAIPFSTTIWQQQQSDRPGIVLLNFSPDYYLSSKRAAPTKSNSSSSSQTTMAFQYEIKVIDCDQKPSKKLQNRSEKEALFKYLPNYLPKAATT